MSNRPTARLITLGCARNDVDSEELAARLEADGWQISVTDRASGASEEPEDVDPDVLLVNTCGFIESAKSESVETILDAASGDARVVAVGCMAERYGKELAQDLPEADAVIGFDGYRDISATLREVLGGRTVESHQPRDRRKLLPISPVLRTSAAPPPGHADAAELAAVAGFMPGAGTQVLRRRLSTGPVAPLKIASGCDRRCAFCAIPRFRGAFLSRTPQEILKEAEWLAGQGVREVVLVSENSTSYGKDLGDPRMLEPLLRDLAGIVPRIRVSYLQPAETRASLIDTIATTDGVASYFDMSFQHASGPLLRRMRRFGNGESFAAMVDQIRAADPDAGVRSNVIVGFPGETDSDVTELIDFLQEVQLDAVGVFGYSEEEGTEAAGLSGALDVDEIAARVAEVSLAVEEETSQRADARVGSELDVLVESLQHGHVRGRAEHQGPEDSETVWQGRPEIGEMVRVTVVDVEQGDLTARPKAEQHE